MEETEKQEKSLNEKIITMIDTSLNEILTDGIQINDVDILYKLIKSKKCVEEEENMNYNYGNYGNNYGRENYGNYNNYGRRGYDAKYRGYGHLDRMYEDYGRYEESKERYGTNEDTKRSLEYMLKSMKDFAEMLKNDAHSREEVMMIKNTAQEIANM